MKWFIKALKHYADFSGRARRKEYWMFVLFNIIFSFVWMFFAISVYGFTNGRYPVLGYAGMIANFFYTFAMLLPGLAVTVRRLHDVGKSGWMLFINLIPIIGGIWLFVLMLTDGQQGENKYGPDPKTSPEIFDDPVKLRSASIMLIIASIASIANFIVLTVQIFNKGYINYISISFNIILYAMLLIAGILLLNEKQLHDIRGKGKISIILLLIVTSIFFVSCAVDVISIFSFLSKNEISIFSFLSKEPFMHRFCLSFVNALLYLSFALLITFILFASQNKTLIRSATLSLIVFIGLTSLFNVYFSMNHLVNPFSYFGSLLPVTYIALAGIFLSQCKVSSNALR